VAHDAYIRIYPTITENKAERPEALLYTTLLLVSGMADNVLKPLLLGRGVDVPMPVILVGALGGMAWNGIIGMFAGATLLALAWQICTGWVDENPDADIHP